MVKQCKNCMWFDFKEVCLNPINDMTYDYFNHSTGELVKNIRRMSSVKPDDVCLEWVKKKKLTLQNDIGEF